MSPFNCIGALSLKDAIKGQIFSSVYWMDLQGHIVVEEGKNKIVYRVGTQEDISMTQITKQTTVTFIIK